MHRIEPVANVKTSAIAVAYAENCYDGGINASADDVHLSVVGMGRLLFCCYFLVFLITCCRIIRISHLQISGCNKGGDVFGYIFCMIDNTGSFQNFPTCSWHATEVYYILLFIRQWHSFSVMVSVMVTMYSVMVFGKSVMVGG